MTSNEDDPLGVIGATVDEKYRVDKLAGEGGFCAVYKAEHLIWNEPVAIKFFALLEEAKPELREKMLGDFIQEGKLMTQLSSRSAAIVQARDVGRFELPDGAWVPYMVLEWLDGPPLSKVLAKERAAGMPGRSLQEALSLLEPVAKAVGVAHDGNVAHRDLKPANIVVLGDPRELGVPVKVLDFGIAKVMAEHEELQNQLQLTGRQISAFTPNYGAPEQFSRNFGATGPWTDVYAFALILIELMRGGRKALEGATLFELGAASCDADFRPTPLALGLEVSDEVEAVFAKAVALRPRDRYSTISELYDELLVQAFPELGPTVPGASGVRTAADMLTRRGQSQSVSTADTAMANSAGTEVTAHTYVTAAAGAAVDPGAATIGSGEHLLPQPVGDTVAAMSATAAPPKGGSRLWLAAAGVLVAGLIGGTIALSGGEPGAEGTTPSGSSEYAGDTSGSSAATKPAASTSTAAAVAPTVASSAAGSASVAKAPAPQSTAAKGPVAQTTATAAVKASVAPRATPAPTKTADPFDPKSFGGR